MANVEPLDASWKDLTLLLKFLAEKHPQYRVELASSMNFPVAQWRASLDKTYGFGEDPDDAAVSLGYQLGHTLEEFQDWVLHQP